jgi:uncharacterized protein (DUF1697 family)
MKQWVALFRGINVGGRNLLPMKGLAELLAGQGCVDVVTYIQSGNVVFWHHDVNPQKLAHKISTQIEKDFGFSPEVYLLSAEDLAKCVAHNPFKQAEQDHKTLHLSFLFAEADNADIAGLKALRVGDEDFKLTKSVYYLYAPNGIGRSKLAAKTDKLLGVSTTSRNWRTVNKLLDMAQKQSEPASTGS